LINKGDTFKKNILEKITKATRKKKEKKVEKRFGKKEKKCLPLQPERLGKQQKK